MHPKLWVAVYNHIFDERISSVQLRYYVVVEEQRKPEPSSSSTTTATTMTSSPRSTSTGRYWKVLEKDRDGFQKDFLFQQFCNIYPFPAGAWRIHYPHISANHCFDLVLYGGIRFACSTSLSSYTMPLCLVPVEECKLSTEVVDRLGCGMAM
jgi:hypothetical protein